MWRGATWVNLNWLIMTGLSRHGQNLPSQKLRETTLQHVDRYYREYGVIFEFYDAADKVAPTRCDRKGPCRDTYDLRVKVDSIRDYHWSAALSAVMLLNV